MIYSATHCRLARCRDAAHQHEGEAGEARHRGRRSPAGMVPPGKRSESKARNGPRSADSLSKFPNLTWQFLTHSLSKSLWLKWWHMAKSGLVNQGPYLTKVEIFLWRKKNWRNCVVDRRSGSSGRASDFGSKWSGFQSVHEPGFFSSPELEKFVKEFGIA